MNSLIPPKITGQIDYAPPGYVNQGDGKLGPDGKPMPKYVGVTDSRGGLLPGFTLNDIVLPKLGQQSNFDQVNMDPTALNMLKDQAFGTGLTPWAQLMMNKQNIDQQNQYDTTAKQSSSAATAAQNQMMGTYGLGAGAMERLATQNQKNYLLSRNAVARQGMSDRSNIGIQDAGTKEQILQALPGFDMNVANLKLKNQEDQTGREQFSISQQAAQDLANANLKRDAQKTNIATAFSDMQGRNKFNSDQYGQLLQAWASNKQAAAQIAQANNSGGSWLCTEAHKALNFENTHKKMLSKFMKEALKIDKETTRFYLFRCAPLVAKMKEKGADWFRNQMFILSILNLVNKGQLEAAFDLYCDETIRLIETFWPECEDPSFFRIRDLRKNVLKKVGT